MATGVSERDRIWIELYYSEELVKAAKYLIPNGNLHEDLLSDALIKVFEKRLDFVELHEAGRLKGYVFQTMSSMARSRTPRVNAQWWARFDKWAQQFGFGETCVEEDFSSVGEHEVAQPSIVSKDEVKYAEELFGCATELGIRLMRKIEECDGMKYSNPELWESAQYVKLYLHFGSYQAVADNTQADKHDVWQYVQKFKRSLNENKMKVAVVTRGREPINGMELYRLYYPYFDGINQTHKDDFEVKHVNYEYLANQPAGALESDVYVFSRLQHTELADKVQSEGKKFVLDLDDYWGLHSDHPLRNDPNNQKYVSTITGLLPRADLVTTTSELLAERIHQEYGVTATVIKNSIPESAVQFQGDKYASSLVRLGWIGGAHHIADLELMRSAMKKLYSDQNLMGKFQVSLAGFNHNEHFVKYESVLSADNYAIRADQDYIEYLNTTKNLNNPLLDHIANYKPYRRIWAKPVSTYGEGYRQLDAVFIPLQGGVLFNACKSELKLIEAGMTKTAAIVSDVKPYAPHLKHEENCLKVSPKNQDWFSQARKIIVDHELREDLADNLHRYVKKNFNHTVETNKLAKALLRIAK